MSKIKTFFICSGLGVINRGYESFTRECFDALKTDDRLDAYLYKGGGESIERENTLFNLPRFQAPAKWLGKLFGKESYTIEQFTFCLSLIPYLILQKPQVLLVSDFILSTYLWHVRRFLNLKYKILFSNGAPNGPPFHRCDHVQQLLPVHYETALKGGTPEFMQSIIPYGIQIPKEDFLNKNQKGTLRSQLNIPEDVIVLLSVAAINNHHKRINYLIEEFSKLDAEKYFLVMLGQIDKESDGIIKLAKEKLVSKNYIISSVTQQEVKSYYRIADMFVLSSLTEGLPRVMIEALSYGLPILVHDYPLAHQVLAVHGYYANFELINSLNSLINQVSLIDYNDLPLKENRKNYAVVHYGWQSLKEKYVSMIEKTANSK